MIADVDTDGSGTIGFDDFLAMMTAKMAERDPREEIMKAFRLFDDDETGKITFKNLKRVAKELGENISGMPLQYYCTTIHIVLYSLCIFFLIYINAFS